MNRILGEIMGSVAVCRVPWPGPSPCAVTVAVTVAGAVTETETVTVAGAVTETETVWIVHIMQVLCCFVGANLCVCPP